jgi:hypothetical protein
MKKVVVVGATLVLALVLPGCPIYPQESDVCYSDNDCEAGALCDESAGICVVPIGPTGTGGMDSGTFCVAPEDCSVNETCSASGICTIGDCSFPGVGCVAGYSCGVADGVHACIPNGMSGTGGAPGAAGGPGAAGEPGTGGAPWTAGGAGGFPPVLGGAGGFPPVLGGAGGVPPVLPGGAGGAAPATVGGAGGVPAAGGSSAVAGAAGG